MAAELVQFAIVCQKSIAKISSKIHLESLEHTHPPCEGQIPVFNILTYFSWAYGGTLILSTVWYVSAVSALRRNRMKNQVEKNRANGSASRIPDIFFSKS